jgi:hypothetical protein
LFYAEILRFFRLELAYNRVATAGVVVPFRATRQLEAEPRTAGLV